MLTFVMDFAMFPYTENSCSQKLKSLFYLQTLIGKSIVKFTGRITLRFILPAKSKFYWQNKGRICFTSRISAGSFLPVKLGFTGRIRAGFILPVKFSLYRQNNIGIYFTAKIFTSRINTSLVLSCDLLLLTLKEVFGYQNTTLLIISCFQITVEYDLVSRNVQNY